MWFFSPSSSGNFLWKLNINQSFENENACVFMNKIKIKDEIQEAFEGNPSLQTKERKNLKNNLEKWKKICKSCMSKKYFGNNTGELHCVEHFNVSMIIKTLILSLFGWHIVFFVTLIQF